MHHVCLQPDGLREAKEAEQDCGFSDGQLGRSTEYARPSIECRVARLRFRYRLLVKDIPGHLQCQQSLCTLKSLANQQSAWEAAGAGEAALILQISLTAICSSRSTLSMSRIVLPMPVTAISEHAVARKLAAVIEFLSAWTAYVCRASLDADETSIAHAPLQSQETI